MFYTVEQTRGTCNMYFTYNGLRGKVLMCLYVYILDLHLSVFQNLRSQTVINEMVICPVSSLVFSMIDISITIPLRETLVKDRGGCYSFVLLLLSYSSGFLHLVVDFESESL